MELGGDVSGAGLDVELADRLIERAGIVEERLGGDMTDLVDDLVRVDPCIRHETSGGSGEPQAGGVPSKTSGEAAVIGMLL